MVIEYKCDGKIFDNATNEKVCSRKCRVIYVHARYFQLITKTRGINIYSSENIYLYVKDDRVEVIAEVIR